MTINKLKSLAPETWLNDEVINFYFNMLTEACNHHKLGIHCFSSFFFIKLLVEKNGYHFNKVKRWTKKIDIFALNKIFIPVNITNTHWGLVLIDIVLKTIIYFDSFRHSGPYASAALQVSTLTILVVLF
jgi:sentrin-specific protease 1